MSGDDDQSISSLATSTLDNAQTAYDDTASQLQDQLGDLFKPSVDAEETKVGATTERRESARMRERANARE